ncbi:hypothetical protein [Hoylesella enoeca]|uniref:hypothetical protein n=1 Tax=Hoylesella enoeca TaxID=76123 RepID=UPI0006861743|nr:hypothetical protein [Hoylesella enoeca]
MLENVSQDYELMKDFMLKGYQDDKRATLYEGMLRKLYRVWSYLRVSVKIQESQAYRLAAMTLPPGNQSRDDIRRRLESFVQDVTMLSLESESVNRPTKDALYASHQAYIAALFDVILSHLHGMPIRQRVSNNSFCRQPSTQTTPNCW